MKSSMFLIAASVMLAATVSASENTPAAGHEVVARQGTATVDGLDVDAHVAPMPAENRAGFLDSPKRIDQMLRHMLLRRNLANEAKERGLDKDPVVQREFEQAAESILMRRRLEQIHNEVQVPDLQALAKERYLADPSKFQTTDQAELVHVLLKVKAPEDEAQVLAKLRQWRADVLAGKAKLEDIAAEYSDEPVAKTSRGVLPKSSLSRYVPEFAEAARKLRHPGDLSEPVKTQFGWHLIQTKSFDPGRKLSFDEVRDRLVQEERRKYIDAEVEKYISGLKDLPIEASEESIAPLRQRYGVLDYDAVEQAETTEPADQETPKQ